MKPWPDPSPGRRPTQATLIRLAVGVVVGGGALWLAVRDVDPASLWNALLRMDPGWTALALLSVLATLIVGTVRWRLMFYPLHRSLAWQPLFWGIVVGQMLNIVVPFRLGDAARIVIADTDRRLTKTRATATLVVEKVVDLTAYALIGLLILATWTAPSWFQQMATLLLITSLLAVLALVTLSFGGRPLLRWVEARAPGPVGGWRQKGWSLAYLVLDGLGAVRSGQANLALWVLTALILWLSAGTNYLLFQAFDLPLSFGAAVFLLLVLQAGIAPPSLPGKLGVFHYLTSLTLSLWAVDRSVALSYAFALYGVALLSKVVLGVAWLLLNRPAIRPVEVAG